jgi:hypothetical protein
MTVRRGRALGIALGVLALVVATAVWFSHPVCRPLTDEFVAEAAKYGPLETRTDRQLHGPIWQRRDGRWYQCKSWISRKLFF